MTQRTMQSFAPEPARTLSECELDLVAGGPIFVAPAIVYGVKVGGAFLGGAAAAGAATWAVAATIDGIQGLFN